MKIFKNPNVLWKLADPIYGVIREADTLPLGGGDLGGFEG
jgi:hypothetical protein